MALIEFGKVPSACPKCGYSLGEPGRFAATLAGPFSAKYEKVFTDTERIAWSCNRCEYTLYSTTKDAA